MNNALTYLTRRCPRQCEYCNLRDAKGIGKELSPNQWIEAFKILKDLNIDFNLILGNETWLLGDNLLRIMKKNTVPYALYTSCPDPLFSKYRIKFFSSGVIDNLSCGVDYLGTDFVNDDSYWKSMQALLAFGWIKDHYPNIDTQGTITIHKRNFRGVPKLVQHLSDMGVFIGINFIHWNKDGKYDFFPDKQAISNLLFTKEDYNEVQDILNQVIESPGLLQNPEFIKQPVPMLVNMGWHCNGDPYGGPSIDADGQLRCCGYRRGKRTPKYSVFQLPTQWCDVDEAMFQDAMECPGCAWSYPWMYEYWETTNESLGKQVFVKHAGNHIDKNKWSKRNLE